MIRFLYATLLRLHPKPFRQRFGEEMMGIFEQATGTQRRAWLLSDGLSSLARQWVLRPEFRREAVPLAAAQDSALVLTAVDLPTPVAGLLLRGVFPALGLSACLMLAIVHAGINRGITFSPYFDLARAVIYTSPIDLSQESDSESATAPLPPDTKPVPADEITIAILNQFKHSDAIALGESLSAREDSHIRIDLVRSPAFAANVGNIVFECGNAIHQGAIDRFLRGEDVPLEELRKIWRDVLTPGACDSPVYEEFLRHVRMMNRRPEARRKIRVLAAGPPIDWARVKARPEVEAFVREADALPARMVADIVGRGEKVLIVFGAGHLWRHTRGVVIPNESTLVSRIDKQVPGRLFTVLRMSGPSPAASSRGAVFVPLKGSTWGKLDANTYLGRGVPFPLFPDGAGLEQVADAVIYTGPGPDTSIAPAEPDEEYAAEITRRIGLRSGK